VGVPVRLAQEPAVGRHAHLRAGADGAVEAAMRQPQLKVEAVLADDPIPAVHAALAIGHVVVAQPLVERRQRRLLRLDETIALERDDAVGRLLEQVIVGLLRLLEAPLEPQRVEVGGVGRDLRAEEVEGDGEVEVQVALDRRQVDDAVPARVVVRMLLHDLARALHDAADAALADEHMVRFFGEHEAARARERIEAALGEARELVLAVTVREEAEHEEAEPVRRLLVERAEDARLVAVARAPLQQRLRLLAAVAPEVGLEQVDHRPQVAALLDVHLEEVAQVVERGAGAAEVPLLPFLQRALQAPVAGEVDVVRDALQIVDGPHHTLLRSKSLRSPVPYTWSAPFGPTAFGRWKIQFCQAERRPKILVSSVSGPPKRSEASIPVSASGENAARASSACRTSSSQSMSSGVNVTSPASAAVPASRAAPT